MKLGHHESDLDSIDMQILGLLQSNCKLPWGKIAEQVGLSAPSVIERVKKLEENGIITGYRAILNGRALGMDITAFIGVSISHPENIQAFERQVDEVDDVLECHHVTGGYTLLLKVKTHNTASLEELIQRLRSFEGVARTETMVVLSTKTERIQIHLQPGDAAASRKSKRTGEKPPIELKRA